MLLLSKDTYSEYRNMSLIRRYASWKSDTLTLNLRVRV